MDKATPTLSPETLARFGHHPNPAIDFCAEVDAIEAEVIDRAAGLPPQFDVAARTAKAMEFTVGGDSGAVVAKQTLRLIDATLRVERLAAQAAPSEPPLSVARIAHIGDGESPVISLVWHVATRDLEARGVTVDALLYVQEPPAQAHVQPQADHIADTSNMVSAPMVSLALGPVAFEFSSFQHWVNKAQGWFRGLALTNRNAALKRYLAIDAAGRVCMNGGDFARARDEDKFPVRVHLIDAAPDEANPEK